MTPWVLFFLSATVIVIAGTKLSYYGDRLADQTGLGGLWIGVILMAGATSLPEVFTTISASILDVPDIAAGDLFGAVMTNMLTLGLIDQVFRRQQVWRNAAFGHALVATLAMVMTALAGLFILLDSHISVFAVGLDTLALLILYIIGMRLVYRQEETERRRREAMQNPNLIIGALDTLTVSKGALRRSAIKFSLAAVAILAAAPLLAWSGEQIALITGVSTTFVGTFLVAITTSLPELVTSIAAVRLGAIDLAVGNLFGSNAFNIAALFFADVAYRQGPLLGAVTSTHALSALWGLFLMNVALMGIIYRGGSHTPQVRPGSLAMIGGYALGMWLLFG